jgi:glycine betaine/proline transport system ATP-binding protein
MRTLDQCNRINGAKVCLDPGTDSWINLGADNSFAGLTQGADSMAVQNWARGESVDALDRRPTLVNADISMRDALQIRYRTGNKLVLEDNNQVVGILGDTELYHALLGKNHG